MPVLAGVLVMGVLAGVSALRPATPPLPTHPERGPAQMEAASDAQIRAASWNICGEAGGSFGDAGYCPHRDEPDRKVGAILNLVKDKQLNVVMLQEACSGPLVEDQEHGNASMLDRLKAGLGPTWSAAWAEMPRPGGRSDCRGALGGTLSVVVAVQGKIVQTTRKPLPVPHGSRSTDRYSQPTVLCVQVQNWRTEVCTTHLVNDDLTAEAYAAELAALTDFVAARPPESPQVIIGGDFNTRRWGSWLKPLHDRYDECDEQAYGPGDIVRQPTIGPATGDGKIDYLFANVAFTGCEVPVNGYQNTSITAVPNGISDHAPIVGYTSVLP
ncbi:endonuclease/exonuclease/phosphatase family protein [Actinoplanes sp. NPDC051859]|uniref:endonuclease/exonuclease/phosphatase family protein n=1 Tax=Actinoplanes sp. NPDC051859 TaxID=3363909 RepID=UPI0037B69389